MMSHVDHATVARNARVTSVDTRCLNEMDYSSPEYSLIGDPDAEAAVVDIVRQLEEVGLKGRGQRVRIFVRIDGEFHEYPRGMAAESYPARIRPTSSLEDMYRLSQERVTACLELISQVDPDGAYTWRVVRSETSNVVVCDGRGRTP